MILDTARTNTPAGYPARRYATSAWPLCICSFGHRALRACIQNHIVRFSWVLSRGIEMAKTENRKPQGQGRRSPIMVGRLRPWECRVRGKFARATPIWGSSSYDSSPRTPRANSAKLSPKTQYWMDGSTVHFPARAPQNLSSTGLVSFGRFICILLFISSFSVTVSPSLSLTRERSLLGS